MFKELPAETWRLLRSPEALFEDKVRSRNIRTELLVVTIIGILGAIGPAYFGLEFYAAVDKSASKRESLRLALLAKPLVTIVGAHLVWLFYTVILHFGASQLYNAMGSMKRALRTVAWSLFPLALGNLVLSVAFYIGVESFDFPAEPEPFGPRAEIAAVTADFMAENTFLFVGASVITALLVVYCGRLLIIALQKEREMSYENARMVAAIPVIIHLGFIGYSLLGNLGIL